MTNLDLIKNDTIKLLNLKDFLTFQKENGDFGIYNFISYVMTYLEMRKTNFKYDSSFDKCADIIPLYNDFLDNYVKLESKFNINNSLSSFYFFNYLRENGYLSADGSFIFDNDKSYNLVNSLNGMSVLTGYGVCRHIAPLFVDILRKKGFDSDLVYTNSLHISDIKLNDELNKKINSSDYFVKENKLSFLLQLLDFCTKEELEKIKIEFMKTLSIEKVLGNHIVVAVNDKVLKLYDPTNKEILYPSDNDFINNNVQKIENNSTCEIVLLGQKKYIDVVKSLPERYESMISNMESYKETKNILEKEEKRINKLCFSEFFEFRRFYDENKDIYSEIHKKLKTLK